MPDIQKVSVALTGEQVTVLKAAVETGEYATTGEAVREALREWQWKRELRSEDLKRLRELWREGKASGPAVSLDLAETREEARQRFAGVAESLEKNGASAGYADGCADGHAFRQGGPLPVSPRLRPLLVPGAILARAGRTPCNAQGTWRQLPLRVHKRKLRPVFGTRTFGKGC